VDAAVHAAFLVVAAFAIWQSQVLTVLWDYLRH